MAKQASKTEQTGNIGEAAVRYQFSKLGWHVADNPAGEVGTDLLLQTRDDRLLDLGAMIGAQVKNGPTQFNEPKLDENGNTIGWWFRDSTGEHIKYWLDHCLQHILVLHDESTETSYWVHVTDDKVEPTGKGMKILVPKKSTVDSDYVDELLKVATAGRAGSRWEGSAWNGGTAVASTDRLRYALLTPRLVAPHPSRSIEEASPHEAIALLVKMRLRNLQPARPGHKSAVPDLESCRSSPEWQWRLYAALYNVLVDGESSNAIQALVETAPTTHERAAASVIVCAMDVEDQNPQAGLDTIERALTTAEQYTHTDHDWLLLHKARCLSEIGELEQARSIAATVQRLRTLEPNDPTATAIAGAGADIIFTVSGWDSDLSEVITGRDTIASWWRTQEISSGLQHHFDAHFQGWTTHTAGNGSAEGDTWLRLRTAALLAGMAAEHSAWRHTSALLAKHILTFTSPESDSGKIAQALTALRRAGDSKALELAVKRLLDSGPASAVRNSASEVNLDNSTRTSLHAELELLAAAADVLDRDTADRTCRWILSSLTDLDVFAARFKPTFTAEHALLETLTALVPVLSDNAVRDLIEHILSLPSNGELGWGHAWAKLARRIPSAAWSEEYRAALSARDDDNDALRHAVTTVVAEGDPQRRDQLRAGIREGKLDDLEAFGDVRDLDAETVDALCRHLDDRIDEMIAEMQKGQLTGYSRDPAGILVLINVWHPDHARWEPVRKILTFHSPAWVSHLEGTLNHLRRLGDHVPDEVGDTLVGPLRTLMLTGIRNQSIFSGEDVRGLAGGALAAIKPDAITDIELWDLMEGPSRDHQAAAIRLIAARSSDGAFDTLWAMSRDNNPWTRALVANQLALTASTHEDDAPLSALLERLLEAQGTLTARMVAVTLRGRPHSTAADRLADVLREHVSAEVRSYIAEYESGAEVSD